MDLEALAALEEIILDKIKVNQDHKINKDNKDNKDNSISKTLWDSYREVTITLTGKKNIKINLSKWKTWDSLIKTSILMP